MGQNTARLMGGAAAAVIVAVAVIALLPRVAPQLAPPPAPSPAAGADAAAPPADQTAAVAPTDAPTADGPRVDTFLLDADGMAVVAGHASPNAKVTILLDDVAIATTQADASGGFAATAEIASTDRPRSLRFAENDAAPSGETVLVRPGAGRAATDDAVTADAAQAAPATGPLPDPAAVTAGVTLPDAPATGAAPSDPAAIAALAAPGAAPDLSEAGTPATAAPEVTIGTAASAAVDPATTAPDQGSADATGDMTAAATPPDAGAPPDIATIAAADLAAPAVATPADPATSAATPPAVAATAPAAPATIVVDDQGARVLAQGPTAIDRVALDAITYDDTGAVQLAGRAPGDTTLQVYVDNQPVTSGPVGPLGDWRLALPQVAPGTYTLRIDEVDAQGDVVSRVETPFLREPPQAMAALAGIPAAERARTQTVQPGNTLWAIARDRLGEGLMYVALFEANADQIRDPDLIYPGQVFVIPAQP